MTHYRCLIRLVSCSVCVCVCLCLFALYSRPPLPSGSSVVRPSTRSKRIPAPILSVAAYVVVVAVVVPGTVRPAVQSCELQPSSMGLCCRQRALLLYRPASWSVKPQDFEVGLRFDWFSPWVICWLTGIQLLTLFLAQAAQASAADLYLVPGKGPYFYSSRGHRP